MHPSLKSLLLAALCATPAAAQMGQGVTIPATPFLKPAGPYGVGTHDFLWIDQKRAELYTKDTNDKRHLMVQIWYPADVPEGAKPALYVQHPDEFLLPAEFKPVLHVTTNAVTDAPVARAEKKYPVLLYNHGGGWNRFSATFLTEQLASHGYVVVSVEHAGFAKIGTFPDGYKFAPDTLTFPKPSGVMKDDVLASWAYLNDVAFGVWMQDAEFALDQVEELEHAGDSQFKGRLDLDHIGALGWSFGGAEAMQLSRVDPRIKAAIDDDGQLFGDVRDKGTARPFLQFHNTSDPLAGQTPEAQAALKPAIEQVYAWDRAVKEQSTGDWYDVKIAKTNHGSFSDLMLFFPSAPGQIDPRKAHEIINAYTLAFFDKYLRGKSSDLLSATTSPYPEVTYTKRK